MELSIISEEHFLRFFLFGALGTPCFSHSNVVKTHIYSPSWVWETVWETAGAGPCLALLNVITRKMAILWYGTKPTLPTLATFFHFPDQIMWRESSINQDGDSTWRRRSRKRTCCRCYKRLYFTAENQWVTQHCHSSWILLFDCLLFRHLLRNSSRIFAHRDQLLACRFICVDFLFLRFVFSAYKTVSGVNGPLVILDDVKVWF